MVQIYLVQGGSGVTTYDFLAVKVSPDIIVLRHRGLVLGYRGIVLGYRGYVLRHRGLGALLYELIPDIIQSLFIWRALSKPFLVRTLNDLLVCEVCDRVQSG